MLKRSFLQDNCTDEVRITNILALFTGSRTYKVILSGFKAIAGAVVQLFTAVSTADNTGEHITLACSGRAALILPQLLHTVKCFFIHNRIMGVLENLPLRLGVFDLLFALVGLPVGSEVDQVAQIFRFFQYS